MDELTIAFKIESPPSWLPIGRTAENNWRTVEIDCSYWFNMNANGEVVLMYKPSCGMSPYPLLTERDGDNIVWRPKSGELVEGVGRLQAFFEVGTDVIGSSDMISCEVDSSLLGADPGTDPGQTDLPWALDIIAQIAELSGHYPKIVNGVLYVWDSEQEDWVQFQGGGSNPNAVLYTQQTLTDTQQEQARENIGAGTYSKPSSGIPDSDIASAATWNAKGTYSKPSGGIPATDLASAVQTSLGKADTALQTAPVTSVNGMTGSVTVKTPYYLTVTENDGTITVDKTPAEIDALSAEGYDVHLRHDYLGYHVDYRYVGYTSQLGTAALTAGNGVTTFIAAVRGDKTVFLTYQDYKEQLGNIDGQITALQSDKADKSEIPSLTGYATETWVEGKGYQTASDVQTAIAAIPAELPAVTASDNGKFLVVENGAWSKGYQATRIPRVAMTASDTTPTLDPNKLYVFPEMATLTPTFATPTDSSIVNEYHFIFTSGATATTLTLPASVLQPDGFTVEENMHYEISILEGAMTAQGWAVSTS